MDLRRMRVVGLCVVALGLAAIVHLGCDGTTEPNGQQTTRQDITGDQLQAMMADGNPLVLIDVRTPEEYITGHIPGTVNQPLDAIATWSATLDAGARTCCICRSGGRSTQAADNLIGQGFTQVYNLTGGMLAWTGPTE